MLARASVVLCPKGCGASNERMLGCDVVMGLDSMVTRSAARVSFVCEVPRCLEPDRVEALVRCSRISNTTLCPPVLGFVGGRVPPSNDAGAFQEAVVRPHGAHRRGLLVGHNSPRNSKQTSSTKNLRLTRKGTFAEQRDDRSPQSRRCTTRSSANQRHGGVAQHEAGDGLREGRHGPRARRARHQRQETLDWRAGVPMIFF